FWPKDEWRHRGSGHRHDPYSGDGQHPHSGGRLFPHPDTSDAVLAMTDEEDRRKQQPERRHPSEKDDTAMPRRARDSSRVRAAIRNELEEIAEESPGSQTETRPVQRVITLENIYLAFENPILE